MKTFLQQYRDLEMQVHRALREKIEASTIESSHGNFKCIPISLSWYEELALVNDCLTFMDSDGMHYDILCDTHLEDLIYILEP